MYISWRALVAEPELIRDLTIQGALAISAG
jgi:hypothetical protein